MWGRASYLTLGAFRMSSSVQSAYSFVVDTSILIDFVIRLSHIVLLSKTLPLRIFPFLYKMGKGLSEVGIALYT
jgi:hypothetical protein